MALTMRGRKVALTAHPSSTLTLVPTIGAAERDAGYNILVFSGF